MDSQSGCAALRPRNNAPTISTATTLPVAIVRTLMVTTMGSDSAQVSHFLLGRPAPERESEASRVSGRYEWAFGKEVIRPLLAQLGLVPNPSAQAD